MTGGASEHCLNCGEKGTFVIALLVVRGAEKDIILLLIR